MASSWGTAAELIDQDGRLWCSTDPALSRTLRGRLAGQELIRYAVMNLGFVSLAPGEHFIRLACRPSILEPATIVSTLYYVHDHVPATIGLDYFTDTWNHLIVRDRGKFQSLLAALAGEKSVGGQEDRLLRRPIERRKSPHRGKLSAVRRIFGTSPSLEEVKAPLDKLFCGRWSLHELNPESGHTIVRGIGQSYTPFNPSWLATAVGSSLCSYADERYGLWVAAQHREALESDQPMFDEVDAVLEFPSIGAARACYSRLTLSVTVRNEPRLILSAAVSDSSINLRAPAVDKAG
ncbi:MAG: hypothetical protein SFW09_12625 [Hyphomicrobiaceae bacterium]|nr:hypothetical protein [Hyphomicrobiaceae bacterium]